MTVVLVVVLTIVIALVVIYAGAWAGMRYRSRQQVMPVGWPLAAAESVVVERSPEAARELIVEVLAARGAHAKLTTPSQLIFTPRLVPSGPFGSIVSVWFRPSVGVAADETELLIEGQDVWQVRRGISRTPERGPLRSRREVDEVLAALEVALA